MLINHINVISFYTLLGKHDEIKTKKWSMLVLYLLYVSILFILNCIFKIKIIFIKMVKGIDGYNLST